jgi:predicted Zn-dependent protease
VIADSPAEAAGITTGDQLAVIVGHELAHVNLGHLEKKNVNA